MPTPNHQQCRQIIFTCYSLNIAAARKEVEEESSTFGDSDHPIVISDSPEKKSVRYEGCGPGILKARIGAKFRYNEGFRTCLKLDVTLARQKLHRVAATKIARVNGPLDSTPAFHDGKKEMPVLQTPPRNGKSFKSREIVDVLSSDQPAEAKCTRQPTKVQYNAAS